MLSYSSAEKKEAVAAILTAPYLTRMLDNGRPGEDGEPRSMESRLTHTLAEIFIEIYKNKARPSLHIARIPEPGHSVLLYIDGAWVKRPSEEVARDFYCMLQDSFGRVLRPVEYYMGCDKMLEDDPMQIMKHLDSFINNDAGYNWGGKKHVSPVDMLARLEWALLQPIT